MNLSNMEKMNDKPLRRVQGFKFNGATYSDVGTGLNSIINGSRYVSVVYTTENSEIDTNTTVSNMTFSAPSSTSKTGFSIRNAATGGIGFLILWIGEQENTTCSLYFQSSITIPKRATVGIIFDASLRTLTVYIDNNTEEVISTYTVILGSIANAKNTVQCGTQPMTIGVFKDNDIDFYYSDSINSNIKIWNTALTEAQIKEEMKGNVLPALGYWPLFYNTKDYSGNSNNGTVTGTEQYEIVERGIKSINNAPVLSQRGFKANGNTIVDSGAVLPVAGSSQMTIMFWIVFNDNVSKGILGAMNQPTVARGWYCYTLSSGVPRFNNVNSSGNSYFCPAMTPLENGKLYHVAFSMDGLNSKAYVNGVDDTGPLNIEHTSISTVETFNPVSIDNNPNYSKLDGVLSDVKIFNSALTEAQIKEEMKGNVLPALGYWPLQVDTKDYSNNSNNGTVTGTDQYETIQNGLTNWKDLVLP